VRRAAAALLAAAILVPARPAAARRAGRHGARGTILLAGKRVAVRWTDGDTFLILSGPQRGRRARLAGVNSLETFGPVHRMGASDGRTLLAIARTSAAVAAAAGGRCETRGRSDRYGRLLASCPDAARALVLAGHAMVFAIDGPADPGLLALQGEAQRARAGIWSGGAPPLVPTSLHSADEPDLGASRAYDRIADTRTGVAEARPHGRTYRTCEEVCLGEGPERACMTYVPFRRRYRDPPACLR
jgi:endonuclease YncB( thermonuclease family)